MVFGCPLRYRRWIISDARWLRGMWIRRYSGDIRRYETPRTTFPRPIGREVPKEADAIVINPKDLGYLCIFPARLFPYFVKIVIEMRRHHEPKSYATDPRARPNTCVWEVCLIGSRSKDPNQMIPALKRASGKIPLAQGKARARNRNRLESGVSER